MNSLLIAYAQKTHLNTHSDISSGAWGLNVGLSPHLYQYFVNTRQFFPICIQALRVSSSSCIFDNNYFHHLIECLYTIVYNTYMYVSFNHVISPVHSIYNYFYHLFYFFTMTI